MRKEVSELLALKIENLQHRLLQIATLHQQWTIDQKALVEQARLEVGAPVGSLYNTETRTFQSPNGSVPLSTSSKRQAKRAGKTP